MLTARGVGDSLGQPGGHYEPPGHIRWTTDGLQPGADGPFWHYWPKLPPFLRAPNLPYYLLSTLFSCRQPTALLTSSDRTHPINDNLVASAADILLLLVRCQVD